MAALRAAVVVGGVLTAALLAGCATLGVAGDGPTVGSNAIAVAEARNALYDVLDATQVAAGGEWSNRDDPTARQCVIPFQPSGERYPALRIGSAPSDVDVAVAAVVTLWTARGFRLEVSHLAAVTQVRGTTSAGEVLLFRASIAAMTVQGESECRPVV